MIDLEKMQNEETKSKDNNDLMTNIKENELIVEKQKESPEIIKFSYNFVEAPPTYLDSTDVLNEKYILKSEEINLENI